MLNRPALIRQLQQIEQQLFVCRDAERKAVSSLYNDLLKDELSLQKVSRIPELPELYLAAALPPILQQRVYSVVGIDGSQIYPDRHEGISCGLIHAAAIAIEYNQQSVLQLESRTELVGTEESVDAGTIDALRQDYELQLAVETVQQRKTDFILFDGSLLYWHLEQYNEIMQEQFAGRYLASMYKLYEQKIPVIGYVSLPNNTELMRLLTAYAQSIDHRVPEGLLDRDLMLQELQPFTCSALYKTNASVARWYPKPLKPYFLYMHTGTEIARIELPGWLLEDSAQFERTLQRIIDQVMLGDGYPVVLAHAHAHAVINSTDRQYFYHLLYQHAAQRGTLMQRSRKLQHKYQLRV